MPAKASGASCNFNCLAFTYVHTFLPNYHTFYPFIYLYNSLAKISICVGYCHGLANLAKARVRIRFAYAHPKCQVQDVDPDALCISSFPQGDTDPGPTFNTKISAVVYLIR